jgi:hypothetical protein
LALSVGIATWLVFASPGAFLDAVDTGADQAVQFLELSGLQEHEMDALTGLNTTYVVEVELDGSAPREAVAVGGSGWGYVAAALSPSDAGWSPYCGCAHGWGTILTSEPASLPLPHGRGGVAFTVEYVNSAQYRFERRVVCGLSNERFESVMQRDLIVEQHFAAGSGDEAVSATCVLKSSGVLPNETMTVYTGTERVEVRSEDELRATVDFDVEWRWDDETERYAVMRSEIGRSGTDGLEEWASSALDIFIDENMPGVVIGN